MKKLMTMMLLGVVLTAFSTKKEPGTTSDEITELNGYRLRDSIVSLNDFNLWVITTEGVFNEKFVAENEAVAKPDFASQLVIAGKVQTYSNSYKLVFKKIELHNGNLEVYFTVRKVRRGHSAEPVAMSVFPKDGSVKKVNFYHDNLLVSIVPVNNVY